MTIGQYFVLVVSRYYNKDSPMCRATTVAAFIRDTVERLSLMLSFRE